MPDRIFIENLRLSCSVGLSPAERGRPQDVLVDLSVFLDLESAGKADDVERSINYRELRERVSAFVSGKEFGLLESLAEGIAELSLRSPRVERVTVRVRKGKYSEEPSIGVEISRDRRSWSKRS
jgi:FolB domain-containing protein